MATKKITKKYMHEVIRTCDATRIYKLYHDVTGKRPNAIDVYKFIRDNAPTKKIERKAYIIACCGRCSQSIKFDYEFYDKNKYHYALEKLRYELRRGIDNYTKLPLIGKTHLYFASPFYGHKDYNKAAVMRIQGNERFCELICKVANKYLNTEK